MAKTLEGIRVARYWMDYDKTPDGERRSVVTRLKVGDTPESRATARKDAMRLAERRREKGGEVIVTEYYTDGTSQDFDIA